jgi:hypothetical protein
MKSITQKTSDDYCRGACIQSAAGAQQRAGADCPETPHGVDRKRLAHTMRGRSGREGIVAAPHDVPIDVEYGRRGQAERRDTASLAE